MTTQILLIRTTLLFTLLLVASCSQKRGAAGKGEANETTYYTADDFRIVNKTDAHVHISQPLDTALIEQAKEDNFRMLTINVYKDSGIPIEQQQAFAVQQVQQHPHHLAWATTFSLANFNEETWHEETLSYLEDSFSKGAIAVKVWKNIGFFLKDTNGELVMIDNPRFDPVLKYLSEKNIPLIGHLGEHKNSWLPIEEMTVKGNQDYARVRPQEHMYLHPERPSYEEYIRVRDNMLEKNPDLRFIGAHMGSLEWSVDELAKRLDKFPNMAVDMAERISHLQYQCLTEWQKVRDFVIKYQDRLLYATDLRSSAQDFVNKGISDPEGFKKHIHEVWLRHWIFFTSGEEMSVPKVEGEFRGLKLPRVVIDKIYYKNSQRWLSGMPK